MDNPRFVGARLDTWKSIAEYLGRSSRTAQRWHVRYGLPVHHLGSDSSSVFAYPDELDIWLKERNPETNQEMSSEAGPPALAVPAYWRTERRGTARTAASAADLFSYAEKMWESLSESNVNAIARIYRELIDFEPWNAKGFAGLASAFIAEGVLCRLHSDEAFGPAQASLRRALQLDRNLFETRCADALVKMLIERDWQRAEVMLNELIEERPTSTRPFVGLALLRIAQGNFSNVASLLRTASGISPLNAGVTALFCWAEYLSGNFESALRHINQEHDIGHFGTVLDATEALATLMLRGPAEGLKPLEMLAASAPRHFAALGVLGYAYAMNGEASRARQVLERMTEPGLRGQNRYSYSIALTQLGLGRTEEAAGWIETSYRQNSLWSLGFKWDPILAPLRRDPLCNSRLEQLGYPVPVPTSPRVASTLAGNAAESVSPGASQWNSLR